MNDFLLKRKQNLAFCFNNGNNYILIQHLSFITALILLARTISIKIIFCMFSISKEHVVDCVFLSFMQQQQQQCKN